MSRHSLLPRPHWQAAVSEVVIGWDPPLGTFFVQVVSRRGSTKVWKGTSISEIQTAAAAITIASDYALMPDELKGALERDKAATADRCDSPLQVMLKSEGLVR